MLFRQTFLKEISQQSNRIKNGSAILPTYPLTSVCKYILAFSADWIDFMLLFSYICVTMTKIQFFKSAVNRLPAAAYFHVHVNICQNRV